MEQRRRPASAMVYYECAFLKHNALFVFLVLVAPAIVMTCFKFFFDSALSFGFKNEYKRLDTAIDVSALPPDVFLLELGPTSLDYISTTILQEILADNERLFREYKIASFSPGNMRIRMFDNLTQVQVNKLAILADNVVEKQRVALAEALVQVNLSLADYEGADKTPVLFTVFFNETEGTISSPTSPVATNYTNLQYQLTYNQTLYDALNPYKNDSWNLFTYSDKYRNPLGIALQIYVENAILLNKNRISQQLNYDVRAYPIRQMKLTDPTLVAHVVYQLAIITLFICVCCYLGRDRNRQQKALRMLSMDEFSYQVVRMASGILVCCLSSFVITITGYLINMFPFSHLTIPSNIGFGFLISVAVVPFCQVLIIVLGGSGPTIPIIAVLLITIVTNFVLELMFYFVMAIQSFKDSSIVLRPIYYALSVCFGSFNAINFLDIAKLNTKNLLSGMRVSLEEAMQLVTGVPLAKQPRSGLAVEYYALDGYGQVLLYSVGNFVFFFVAALYLAYRKPEPYFQGMSPFKLLCKRYQAPAPSSCVLRDFNIFYRSLCKKTQAIQNFSLDFQQIQEQHNIEQIRLGLLGVSGAGKSSILNVMSGQLKPEGAETTLLGFNLKKSEQLYLLKRHVSICPQGNENVLEGLTVLENVRISLLIYGFDSFYQNEQNDVNFNASQRITTLLKNFQLFDDRFKPTQELSGGMLRRLSLCNAIVANHSFFIFDEISSGLDPFSCKLIDKEVLRIKNPFILSTHDMKQVKDVCNYMVIMRRGRVQCQDTVQAVQLQFGKISVQLQYDAQKFSKAALVELMQRNGISQEDYYFQVETNKQFKLVFNAPPPGHVICAVKELERLKERGTINKMYLDKGALGDIFIELASTENANENIVPLVDVPVPSIGKDRTTRGLLRLYWKEDRKYSVVGVPFVVLFVVATIAATALSVLAFRYMKEFTDYQLGMALTKYETAFIQGCAACCGLSYAASIKATDVVSACQVPSCFSDGELTVYSPSFCQGAAVLASGFVLVPAIKQVDQLQGRSMYNSGVVNNFDKILEYNAGAAPLSKNELIQLKEELQNDSADLQQFAKRHGQYSVQCLECMAICEAGCTYHFLNAAECRQQCTDVTQTNNLTVSDTPCQNACAVNLSQPAFNVSQVDAAAYQAALDDIVEKQEATTQSAYTLLQSSYSDYTTNAVLKGYVPQTVIMRNNSNITLNSFIPSYKGSVAMYSEFNVKFTTLQQTKNSTALFPNQTEFWTASYYFGFPIDKIYNYQYPIYNSMMPSEMADSLGLSIRGQPFDQVAVDINRISNEYMNNKSILSLNIAEPLQAQNGYDMISSTAQPYPYYPDKYESQTFATYLNVVQISIITIVFCLPILKAACMFTHLKNTQIENIVQIHGLTKLQFYGVYLLYMSGFIVVAAALCTVVARFIKLDQADSPVLFCVYLFDIGFGCTVFGMIIAQFAGDKKQAALISALTIICCLFVSVFLMRNQFVLLLLPQVFATHRLMYLTHTTAFEACNVFVSLLVSLIYFFAVTVDIEDMFEKVVELRKDNCLFNYAPPGDKIITYKETSEPLVALADQDDLMVSKLNVYLCNTHVIQDLSFSIQRRHVFGLLGLSGSGKSVTIKTLIKQLEPISGQIEIRTQSGAMDLRKTKKNVISYVPQQDILFEKLSIKDHIEVFGLLHGHRSAKYIESAVEQLGLTPHLLKKANQLSGGMKRRLSFLLALTQTKSQLIAFDECSTGLSPDLKIIVWNVISRIGQQFSKACIVTTHYMDEIEALADEVVVLKNGRVEIRQVVSDFQQTQKKTVKTFDSAGELRNTTSKAQWSEILDELRANNTEKWITENADFADSFLLMYERLVAVESAEK